MTDTTPETVTEGAPPFVIHFTFELAGLLQWGAEPICEANGPEAYQAVITDASKVTCEDCKRMLADPAPMLAAIRKRTDAAIRLPWSLERESCDCGDGYGCSHGSWPYCIRLTVPNTEHEDGKTRDYDFSYTEISDFPMETAEFMVAARTDVPRLLAAVDAVLNRHSPGPFIITGRLCSKHEVCRNFSITEPEAERIRQCPNCEATVEASCRGCGFGITISRCPDRRNIAEALTGASDQREDATNPAEEATNVS